MKDIFNGKIKHAYVGEAVFVLIFIAVLMFAFAIFMLFIALLAIDLNTGERILSYSLSGLFLIFAVALPACTVYFVKRNDKYPRIARLFFQGYYFAKKGIIHSKRRRKHS